VISRIHRDACGNLARLQRRPKLCSLGHLILPFLIAVAPRGTDRNGYDQACAATIHNEATAKPPAPHPGPIYYCATGEEIPLYEPCRDRKDQRDI
jgi:hypothetical protein